MSRPTCPTSSSPTSRSSSTTNSAARSARPSASSATRLADRYRRIIDARGDRGLAPRRGRPPTSCAWSRRTSSTSRRRPAPAPRTSSRWCARSARRRRCSRRTTRCSSQRSVGKVVFFAKHIDVMDAAEAHFAARRPAHGLAARRPDHAGAPAGDRRVQQRPGRRRRRLLAHRGRRRRQPAGRVERRARRARWTAAEQTQAIDRVHRIGQDEPVTAWRIIAAHTIDAKIAELIDSKQGLAARALDGSDVEPELERLRAADCAHAPAAAGARRRD